MERVSIQFAALALALILFAPTVLKAQVYTPHDPVPTRAFIPFLGKEIALDETYSSFGEKFREEAHLGEKMGFSYHMYASGYQGAPHLGEVWWDEETGVLSLIHLVIHDTVEDFDDEFGRVMAAFQKIRHLPINGCAPPSMRTYGPGGYDDWLRISCNLAAERGWAAGTVVTVVMEVERGPYGRPTDSKPKPRITVSYNFPD